MGPNQFVGLCQSAPHGHERAPRTASLAAQSKNLPFVSEDARAGVRGGRRAGMRVGGRTIELAGGRAINEMNYYAVSYC